MKTLIIPDIHNKTSKVIGILDKYALGVDRIIFLGDWFDDWGDNDLICEETCGDLLGIMDEYRKKATFLLGNHDLSYYKPHYACSGFTEGKLGVVRRMIDQDVWDRFQLYTTEQGWLLSHAGFRDELFSHGVGNLFSGFVEEEERILFGLKTSGMPPTRIYRHKWLEAGYSRGGRQPYGGPLWCDWRDEFVPVEGVNQIVGHTIVNYPDWHGKINDVTEEVLTDNWCLDTNLQHVGFLTDGVFSFMEVQ